MTKRATKKETLKIKPPRFELEEFEDYYTYYVLIMKIPDSFFWETDIGTLDRICDNKIAYDGWLAQEMKKEGERSRGR